MRTSNNENILPENLSVPATLNTQLLEPLSTQMAQAAQKNPEAVAEELVAQNLNRQDSSNRRDQ